MRLIILFLIAGLLYACNDQSSAPQLKSVATKTEKTKKQKGISIPIVKYGIEGFYTGLFEATKYDGSKEVFYNQITIGIDSMNEKNIYGHSVVAGNERPFSGSYQPLDSGYRVLVREPGDHKYDGSFEFTVDKRQKKLVGKWYAHNTELPVTERSYELSYRSFQYDPAAELPEGIIASPIYGTYNQKTEKEEALTEDVLKLNASQKLLKASDVENLYAADLEVIRNAIYARHGYSFKNPRMRTLFDNTVDWYMPVSTNVTELLTETEQKNIALIKRYEKHAARYYDAFGR